MSVERQELYEQAKTHDVESGSASMVVVPARIKRSLEMAASKAAMERARKIAEHSFEPRSLVKIWLEAKVECSITVAIKAPEEDDRTDERGT